MTQEQHPITPPDELVQHLWDIYWKQSLNDVRTAWANSIIYAYQSGADQELEACCEWMKGKGVLESYIKQLRKARRPKPPSLKEQALAAHDRASFGKPGDRDTIRRALEALPD